ncbi:FUSC family protein [Stackebrandtia nassauensis]|uniref:Integral membrane bound transporter domain-containing protein n=1 Tax=Stackebrandtia nassauensis (strain DSM 44728 / CIP 108903 / NRRL B-16338 / NBRC 102104 / LLR-40K-21) TaxID=446470 RepID=D3QA93_STANL|nr:FUSC family protein [Stackebrandtia nassauensis]ADD40805.1 protein of unknown function DUF893 YccS/YhfK [Stackebrandtia nassauensis DSM 44728]
MIIAEPAKRAGKSLLAWDPSAAQPARALKAGLGVAVTLSIAIALGSPDWTGAAVLGTWCAGIPLLAAGVRPQPALPALAGLAIGVAVTLGGLAEPNPVAVLVLSAGWALVMAFLGSLSSALGVVTTVCGVALVLGPNLVSGDNYVAAGAAALAGGLVQSLTSLLPPWQRFRTERSLIAEAYRSLADDARALADAMNTPLSTDDLVQASSEIGGRRKLPEVMRESIAALYELRAAIVSVAAARARLLDTDPTAARHTAAVLRDTASAMDILADAVENLESLSEDWEDRLAAAVDAAPVDQTNHGATARHSMAGREVRRLHRAVHKVARLSERIIEDEPATSVVSRRIRIRSRAAEDWQSLRSQLTWRSPAARHAVRACVVIAIATAVGRYWPGTHGYWVTLTAWIVLKPDFAATVGRGLARILGTAAGVFLASLLSIAVLSYPSAAAPIVAGYALLGYLTLPVSNVVYSVAVAGFSVFQIDLAGQSAIEAAWERGITTVVGGLLALLLYTLWPTWQTRRLPELLAELIDAYRGYADLVLDMQARPAERDPRRLRDAVDEVRLRRAALAAAVDQAAAEPVGGKPHSGDVQDVEVALSRAARALIVLEGAVRHHDAAQLFGVDEFRDSVQRAYDCLADRVRGRQPRPVDLRAALESLDAALDKGTPATIRRRRLLDWESDILVEALSDADLIVKEWQRA